MVLVPAAVETVMSTVPLPGGLTAVQDVVELHDTIDAGALPNFTVVSLAKPRPVMATLVPPLAGPDAGSIAATFTGPEPTSMYLNSVASPVDVVPPVVVTVTSTVPVPGGAVALMKLFDKMEN